ncbi:hypothetical protein ERD95_02175 [Enterobacteriaceae bacterium ML5]|nr:hypothetical protein ERD95_02175 [Enterobacteriaceae bacterium ML5]
MKNITYDRLKDFERDPSNNFLTRSEMMEAVKELIALREAQKGDQVPVAWRHDSDILCHKVVTMSEVVATSWVDKGRSVTPLYDRPQKPVISKEKLCDWLEDNFDIDDSQRDAFANCFAHHCNCIVEKENE